MSDQNTSLPVRTENNGDVVVQVSDGTTATQKLAVDASGRVVAKLADGAGNSVTSQTSGAQRALDVGINVAGVQVDPRATRALTAADVVTANQGTAAASSGAWPSKITDGTSVMAVKAASTAALAADPSAVVALSPNSPLPAGTNAIGTVTSAQGAPASLANAWPVKVTDGTNVSTVKAASTAAVATDTAQVVALSPNTPLPAGTNAIGTVIAKLDDGTGNAITSTVVGGSRALDVNLPSYTSANPLPVTLVSELSGTAKNIALTSVAVANGATVNLDYSVTATKTFSLAQVHTASSGKMKVVVQTSPDGTTFTTQIVGFNSVAHPNADLVFRATPLVTGTGSKVRVAITNLDPQAQDVYATINGVEN